MADEKIVIQVDDKVSNSIARNIRKIGEESRTSHDAVTKLQNALAKLNTSAFERMQTAMDRGTAAATRQQIAAQRLAVAQARAATETARQAAAQDRAALSALRLEQAQERAARAAARQQRSLDAAGEKRALEVRQRLEAVLNRGSAATDKATISQKQYNAAMRGVPAQITDIVVSLQGGQRPLTVLLQQGGQLKDMFGGIVPALRALSRGLVAMINPITILAAVVGGLVLSFASFESKARQVNSILAQFKATGRSDLDKTFVTQLRDELNTLPGVSKSAAMSIINEFAQVRSVGGPIMRDAARLTQDLAYALGTDAPKAAETLAKALDDPLKGAQELDKQLGFLTIQNFKTIDSLMKAGRTAEAQKVIVDALGKAISGLARESMTPFQRATDNLSNSWDKLKESFQGTGAMKAVETALVGIVNALAALLTKLSEIMGSLANFRLPGWAQTMIGAMPDPMGLNKAILAGFGNQGGATGSWESAAGNRTAEQMKPTKFKTDAAGITDKKAAGAAESRAKALAKINAELNDELRLMQLVGPEREKEERMARITESLIGRGIKLSQAEIKAIQEKIDAIVDNAKYTQQLASVYEEVNGPLEEYEARLRAIQALQEKGAITEIDANRQRVIAHVNYERSVNLLYEFNKNLEEEVKLSRMHSQEQEIERRIMELQNDLLGKGTQLREDELNAIRSKLQALQQTNLVMAEENRLLGDSVLKRAQVVNQITAMKNLLANPNSGFTRGDAAGQSVGMLQGMNIDTSQMQAQSEAYKQVYADQYSAIQQMREADLLNEQDYQSARAQIAANQTSSQLEGAKNFFGELSKLQSSNVKEIAQVGKAAAIAQAIINTYEGATKALAQGGIYGAAMAAAVVATGMAQVAQIRAQGFQEGGYTGNGGRSQPAGIVHGKEFVMNASATSRNRDFLEAMNDGRIRDASTLFQDRSAKGGTALNVSIDNQAPGVEFETQQISANDVRVIARKVLREEGDGVMSNNFNNPNSKTFKSMQRNTKTVRNFA